ncbi:unnamed protein product [Clonostachys byssicola]|uniref:Zn(2)-C6 fungal-type domain-containing protein n=1 Tax=Clonostachys byssicola TaxID=160290 RepID=A0A9N9UDQ6_9HYPO|nr:unnamed protein product [Clonostachys byssicola]
MGEARSSEAKMDNQSWRKKPRKFAPKSRLGCKTCKIRRIKCDLAQPSCLKCRSTGRTCDGYGDVADVPSTFSAEVGHERHDIEHQTTGQDSTATSVTVRTRYDIKLDGVLLQTPGAFMILPVTEPKQAEALGFFENVAIKNINEYRPCSSWRKTLMFFSQTEPSVRCAAIALALMHRNQLDRVSGYGLQQPRVPDDAPLLYYNRAIQLLLSQKSNDDTQAAAITLLVCYLFTCFDHLAGNYVQAMKHLRGGIELSRNIDQTTSNEHGAFYDVKPSGAQDLIYQVTRQFHRLDLQAVMFLIDWTPTDSQDSYFPQLSISNTTFQSIEQAADHLQILVTQVMRLRNTEQELSPQGEMPPLPPPFKGITLGQLESWSDLFEHMLQQENSHETASESNALISLLRLQHTIAWTLLKSPGPEKEMGYDSFLPQFRQCVALARDVAAAHERYSGSLKPTFTPEIGIVPVLYMIGVKCRDPTVRREVLDILQRQTIQEAVWDSISTARVVERVIEIEEDGSREGEAIQSMEQIPVWKRVEAMSWVLSPGQMDITYTFCEREGIHLESLSI